MIEQEKQPCWTVTCDGCAAVLGDEGPAHFTSLNDAADAAKQCEWTVAVDGTVTCDGCQGEPPEGADAAAPATA